MPQKWVSFSQEILRHGSHFCQKKSLEVGQISQKLEKKNNNNEISRMRLKTQQEWVTCKKKKKNQQFFEVDVQTLHRTSPQKQFEYPL